MARKSLKSRYEAHKPRREPFLVRGREYAALTLPSLLPPLGFHYSSRLPEPYQGFGGRAVTHLSAKIVTAVLPIGQTFFRLGVPAKTLIESGELTAPPDVERGFTLSEKLIQSETERRRWRQPTTLSLQLGIVTGNALEQMLPDNRIRTFRLDQYVVQRDATGNLLEIIIEEPVAPSALPEAARALLPDTKGTVDSDVELYTCYQRLPDGSFESYQEVAGKLVPGSKGKYREEDLLPVWAIRWAIVPGEDYGRGKVEEHIGDLRALDNFSKSIQDGIAMAARHITLVKANAAGGNLRQRIAKANNGDVLSGNPDDVKMLQFENVAGIQLAQAEVQRLTQALSAAFLMVSDMRRDAERVTAYELKMLAQELEGALGGTYSLLTEDMQRRRLIRLIYQMQKQKQLPPWTKDMVDPQITTGLEALGRQEDIQRVMMAGQITQGLPGAEEYVKNDVLLKIAFNGLGLAQAVKTDGEVQQAREQQMQLAATQQGLGSALGAAGQAAVEQQGAPA